MTDSPREGAQPSHRPVRDLALLMAALLVFACMDASIKYLAAHYSVPLIVAIRYLVHLSLMVMLLAPVLGKQLVQIGRAHV